MAGTGDIMIQLFSCCIQQQQSSPARRRIRIDRTMIGNPTNFVHTGKSRSGSMQAVLEIIEP